MCDFYGPTFNMIYTNEKFTRWSLQNSLTVNDIKDDDFKGT